MNSYYITKLKDRFSLAQSAHVASLHIGILTGWRALAGEYKLLKLDLKNSRQYLDHVAYVYMYL